jgi:S1-C subfamily serine protease
MLYASTHFANVAGPGNTPPQVNAAPLPMGAGIDDQQRIVNAVKRVSPSVVALDVTINGSRIVPADPFAQFFGGQSVGRIQNYHERASGSGFVFSRSGLIVTNAHVVPAGTSSIEAVFANGDRVKAHVFSRNPAADLALVKVDGYAKLPAPIELGDSSHLLAGQWAIAIGEPFELKQSVAVGVVSGFDRDETIGGDDGSAPREFKGLLQTSAPINPGNSGGPLVDLDGRLIGVNQSTANPQAGAQGIGFAIPVNIVRQQVAILEKNPGQTIQSGTPGQSYIGVQMAALNDAIRSQINYQGKTGVAIEGVLQGTPADAAGIQPGDVIMSINGKDIDSPEALTKIIKATKPGTTVAMEVFSGGMKKLVSVKVAQAPPNFGQQQAPDPQQQQQPDPMNP